MRSQVLDGITAGSENEAEKIVGNLRQQQLPLCSQVSAPAPTGSGSPPVSGSPAPSVSASNAISGTGAGGRTSGGRVTTAAAADAGRDAVDRQGRDRLRGHPHHRPAAHRHHRHVRGNHRGAEHRAGRRRVPLARHLRRSRHRLVAAVLGRRAVAVAEQDGVPPMTQVFNPSPARSRRGATPSSCCSCSRC